jgi:3-methyladenine DNA glycosylase AlkD
MEIDEIIGKLEELSNPDEIEGMRRFGINPEHTFAIGMPVLRKIGKECGKSHELAQELWKINTRETRILASIVDIPKEVTPEQMDRWADGFDYWEICDQCSINLFRKTAYVWEKIDKWTKSEKEFVKRAGFALLATYAVSNKKEDEKFIEYLEIIKEESCDNRKMVKKAVNWALRQIGKRNLKLNKIAIEKAKEIDKINCKASHWIAKDAIRELESEKLLKRLNEKEL